MTRRLLSTACLVLSAVISWPATPSGQHFPTLSGDLALHPAGHRGHRVIVQADAGTLLRLRGDHPRGFRQLPTGAAVFDVTDAELDALQRDSSLIHISGDLPVPRRRRGHQSGDGRGDGVAGDQGAARPLDVERLHRQGRRRRHPGLRHRVALRPRLARRGAREPGVDRAGGGRRPLRPWHAPGGARRREYDRRLDRHHQLLGRQRAGGFADRRARARLRRRRADQRRHRRHRLGDRQPCALQHSCHQSLSRSPRDRAVDHRSALSGRGARRRRGHCRRDVRRQLRDERQRRAGPWQHHVAREFTAGDHRRCH